MPKVTFVADSITVEVPAGTPLASVVDEHSLAIPFGCREGQCGTCTILVHEGADSFQPMDDNERETLEMTDAPPNGRLCCQAVVQGDMKIEPL